MTEELMSIPMAVRADGPGHFIITVFVDDQEPVSKRFAAPTAEAAVAIAAKEIQKEAEIAYEKVTGRPTKATVTPHRVETDPAKVN